MSDDEVEAMIQAAGISGNGRVNCEDFIRQMMSAD